MPLRFAYLAVLRVFGWLALLAGTDLAKNAEILILCRSKIGFWLMTWYFPVLRRLARTR